MWLLPFFSRMSSAAVRVYYRLTVAGEEVPAEGPVLLVANHPNSLVDPALVVAVARRPVRFLAKAPVFEDRLVGWLIRAVGSIPVHRRGDDPSLMNKNEEMFAAVFDELRDGAAVGLFPEGVSHSEPSMVELRTGAARIALGTRGRHGLDPRIVPVGLVPSEKGRYRSEMLVVIGSPIAWDDISARDAEDREAVRELTSRIARGLRHVTLNVERWEDRPLVEAAEAIWAEGRVADADPAGRVARLGITSEILAEIRADPQPGDLELIRALRRHVRRLHVLRMRPYDLRVAVDLGTSLRWMLRRAVLLPSAAVALGGLALFRLPQWATSVAIGVMAPDEDRLSTYKLMVGFTLHAIWTIFLAVVLGMTLGLWWGLGALVAIPLLGVAGLRIREGWMGTGRDVRRFYTLRARRELMDELRSDQERLGRELEAVRRRRSGEADPAIQSESSES